jgi:hypothetical protein
MCFTNSYFKHIRNVEDYLPAIATGYEKKNGSILIATPLTPENAMAAPLALVTTAAAALRVGRGYRLRLLLLALLRSPCSRPSRFPRRTAPSPSAASSPRPLARCIRCHGRL